MTDRPLRVLMTCYEYPPIGGGAGLVQQHMLEQFAGREDVVIDALSAQPERGLAVRKVANNVTLHLVGVRKQQLHHWRKSEVVAWLWRARGVYRRIIHRCRPDLVHAISAFPTGWLAYRSRRRVPYVLSLQGSDVPGHNPRLALDYRLMAGLFRRIWAGAAHVIANSHGHRAEALRFMPDLDIDIIPNGIDTGRFSPPADRSRTGPVRLIVVGRLSANKRVDKLIRATRWLARGSRPVQLDIVGDGRQMQELQDLARTLGVSECVTFHGWVDGGDMPQMYRSADLFVMASQYESLNLAMLEAMASGLPVVAARCEGTDELCDNNGIIVDSDEPEALAAAVESMASDATERDECGRRSRRIAKRYSWAHMAERYLEAYRQITDGQNS